MTDAMTTMFGKHALLLTATYRTAVVLISTSGAFTSAALRHALPFTGYTNAEVDQALDVIVGGGDLVASPLGLDGDRLFLPGRNLPVKAVHP